MPPKHNAGVNRLHLANKCFAVVRNPKECVLLSLLIFTMTKELLMVYIRFSFYFDERKFFLDWYGINYGHGEPNLPERNPGSRQQKIMD